MMREAEGSRDGAGSPSANPVDARSAAVDLVRATRRELAVLTHDLDARLYDDAEFIAALRGLAVSRRRARMRFLAREVEPAVRHGHRLLEISRQLTSMIEIRVIDREIASGDDAFLLADGAAFVYRARATRTTGDLQHDMPRAAYELAQRFEALWAAEALPDAQTRRLHL